MHHFGDDSLVEDIDLGGRIPSRRRSQEDAYVDEGEDDIDEGASLKKGSSKKENTALQKSFKESRKGGRVRVDSLDSLWSNFVAKMFGKEEVEEADGEYYEEEEYEDQDERNLWERKIR